MALRKCPDCGNKVSKKATSCPSCGSPLKKKKKFAGCGSLVLTAFLVIAVFSALVDDSEDTKTNSPNTKKISSTENEKSSVIKIDSAEKKSKPKHVIVKKGTEIIPGLFPVDIYLNLTNKGFTKTGPNRVGESVEFICKKDTIGCMSRVEIYGRTPSDVYRVDAQILSYDSESTNAIAQDLLGYVATITYDGSLPEKARQWVENNIDKNASTTFGGMQYRIIASSPTVRILRIQVPSGVTPAYVPKTKHTAIIPGLSPVVISQKLIKEGFTKEKGPYVFKNGQMVEWQFIKKSDNVEFTVGVYGRSTSDVYKIDAMVMNSSGQDTDAVALDFLKYIATVKYKGAKQRKAKKWLEKNISSNASILIGGIKFETLTRVKRVRTLWIQVPSGW